jgi:hypothetical protein
MGQAAQESKIMSSLGVMRAFTGWFRGFIESGLRFLFASRVQALSLTRKPDPVSLLLAFLEIDKCYRAR